VVLKEFWVHFHVITRWSHSIMKGLLSSTELLAAVIHLLTMQMDLEHGFGGH
jgi:hypothetical protein